MRNQDFENKIIAITTGTGSAATPLAAFDAALYDAGIANFNLVHLSSIIPTGYTPKIKKVDFNNSVEHFGARLDVVLACKTEERVAHEAWAGLGWVTTTGKPTRGLFVEHMGTSRGEVESLIEGSLTEMTRYRKERYGKIHHKIVGIPYSDQPVCALVAALYATHNWC